jgi:hypothetical protein
MLLTLIFAGHRGHICQQPRAQSETPEKFKNLICAWHDLRHIPVVKSMHDLSERRPEWIQHLVRTSETKTCASRPSYRQCNPRSIRECNVHVQLDQVSTATISGDKAYLIRIANQSKYESCVVTSTCRMFILNKVTFLYDSSMMLEGYWRAFISLAARDCLVSMPHLLINQICVGRVARGRRLRGIFSREILWSSDKPKSLSSKI